MYIKSQSYVSPGNPERPCEDIVLLMPEHGCYAVFDGASSLATDPSLHSGVTGGLLAAIHSRKAFEMCISDGGSLLEAAQQACNAINAAMDTSYAHIGNAKPDDPRWYWSCAVAAIQVHGDSYTALQIGDSCVVSFAHGDAIFPDCNHDAEELREIHALIREDPTIPLNVAVERCSNIMKDRRATMNHPSGEGYGVLAPNGVVSHYCKTHTERLGASSTFALLTDGLHLRYPGETLSTRDSYVNSLEVLSCALARGKRDVALRQLGEAVREQERLDPRGVGVPRFKCHDDQAGILLEISS